MTHTIKFLTYYLPQFHQIPENDEWWGEGFTEWTNVKKARPLFKGHNQPVIPGELGYYDLLKTKGIQEKQSELALEYGIDGFIYYQYWFGNGKQVLEKPAEIMLENKRIKIPFCFCWANETWSGVWHGLSDKILAKQEYPGEADEQMHFDYLLPFFQDSRYIRIDDKPLYIIYDVLDIPSVDLFIKRMRSRAVNAGLKGLYIMASNKNPDELDYQSMGFDGKISYAFNKEFEKAIAKKRNQFITKVKRKMSLYFGKEYIPLLKFDYNKVVKAIRFKKLDVDTFPMILPNWDNSPRSGRRSVVLINSAPDKFKNEVQKAINFVKESDQKHKIIIIKSWNEWAEGNFIEPDTKYKNGFLKIIKNLKEI